MDVLWPFYFATAVNDGEHVDPRFLHQVDESIRVLDQLANCRLIGLRDNTSNLRKVSKCCRARDESIDHALRIERRCARDMACNIGEVLERSF